MFSPRSIAFPLRHLTCKPRRVLGTSPGSCIIDLASPVNWSGNCASRVLSWAPENMLLHPTGHFALYAISKASYITDVSELHKTKSEIAKKSSVGICNLLHLLCAKSSSLLSPIPKLSLFRFDPTDPFSNLEHQKSVDPEILWITKTSIDWLVKGSVGFFFVSSNLRKSPLNLPSRSFSLSSGSLANSRCARVFHLSSLWQHQQHQLKLQAAAAAILSSITSARNKIHPTFGSKLSLSFPVFWLHLLLADRTFHNFRGTRDKLYVVQKRRFRL